MGFVDFNENEWYKTKHVGVPHLRVAVEPSEGGNREISREKSGDAVEGGVQAYDGGVHRHVTM